MKPMEEEIIQLERARRYESFAHIRIHGFDGEALIRNINSSGFCMASKTYVAINRSEYYKMQIIPEPEARTDTIELEVEVRWTRTSETIFAAGLQIIQDSKLLKVYLAYIEKKYLYRR